MCRITVVRKIKTDGEGNQLRATVILIGSIKRSTSAWCLQLIQTLNTAHMQAYAFDLVFKTYPAAGLNCSPTQLKMKY